MVSLVVPLRASESHSPHPSSELRVRVEGIKSNFIYTAQGLALGWLSICSYLDVFVLSPVGAGHQTLVHANLHH